MQFYGRRREARQAFRQGKRAFFRKEFVYTYRQKQCFLRSKTLMQDSTLGPNCHAIRVCPAAGNLPIFTAFPVLRRRAKRGDDARASSGGCRRHRPGISVLASAGLGTLPQASHIIGMARSRGRQAAGVGGLKMPLPIRKSAANSNFLHARAISIVYLQQCT